MFSNFASFLVSDTYVYPIQKCVHARILQRNKTKQMLLFFLDEGVSSVVSSRSKAFCFKKNHEMSFEML